MYVILPAAYHYYIWFPIQPYGHDLFTNYGIYYEDFLYNISMDMSFKNITIFGEFMHVRA